MWCSISGKGRDYMTRYRIIKELLKRLDDSDVAIFAGKTLCEEAYVNDREGNFYIPDTHSIILSFSLGLAMCTDKRVFVFTTDSEFLRDIGSATQMAVSECKNIFYFVFSSGMYRESGKHPNIFRSMAHPQGVFFRMGFVSFTFDSYFESSERMSELKDVMDTMLGPVSIILEVNTKRGNNKSLDQDTLFFLNRLYKFIEDNNTAMFEPPPLENMFES